MANDGFEARVDGHLAKLAKHMHPVAKAGTISASLVLRDLRWCFLGTGMVLKYDGEDEAAEMAELASKIGKKLDELEKWLASPDKSALPSWARKPEEVLNAVRCTLTLPALTPDADVVMLARRVIQEASGTTTTPADPAAPAPETGT